MDCVVGTVFRTFDVYFFIFIFISTFKWDIGDRRSIGDHCNTNKMSGVPRGPLLGNLFRTDDNAQFGRSQELVRLCMSKTSVQAAAGKPSM